MNPNTRYITAEVLLNDTEKRDAVEVCADLGIALSAWYRGLGKAAVHAHRTRQVVPKESRKCPGVGRQAARSAGFMSQRRLV